MDSFEDNIVALSSTEPDLQSSAMTGSASDESVSNTEEERVAAEKAAFKAADEATAEAKRLNGTWLQDFRSLALSFKQTAGGVASFVHRSAVAIADEIAQLEQEEMEKLHSESSNDENACEGGNRLLPLPWELSSGREDESGIEDLQLKAKIQQLADDDGVFLSPYTTKREEDSEFLDESRISLIRRLLQVDENLARTHARLSGRSDVRETLFWKNYFYHVEQAQASHIVMTTSFDSLVPAEDEEDGEDDDDWEKEPTAFLQVPSPPTSTNSLGVHSVDSMVVIDGPAKSVPPAP